jgi:uncharacterized SAM-binding protein YcdF (DUF218 family)
MTPLEKFICTTSNDFLRKSDVIIILEGDGFARISEGARLFKEEFAPLVLISGGVNNPPHSYTASEMLPKLIEAGVPRSSTMLEEKSLNTRDQAVNVMELARGLRWKRIIIVASHYHQYRAYLTFLKAMREYNLELEIINSPVRNLPWFSKDDPERRIDLLEKEFERIDKYKHMGHLASFEEALEYQEWKESRV